MSEARAMLKAFLGRLKEEAAEKRKLRQALAIALANRDIKAKQIPADFDQELNGLFDAILRGAAGERSVEQRLQRIAEQLAPKLKEKKAKAKGKTAATPKAPAAKPGKRSRAPSPFDPIAKAMEGDAALSRALEPLELGQLQTMVVEFGMDPDGKARKWKTREKLIVYIVETAGARRDRGSAFLR
jgi:hypothetical protein